jgi:hypothetical protein
MKHYKLVKTVVEDARVRHYHSGSHTPYRGVLHDRTHDEELIQWHDSLHNLLSSLPEGSVVSIQVLVNEPEPEEIDPDDIWVLDSPHTYVHKSKAQARAKSL